MLDRMLCGYAISHFHRPVIGTMIRHMPRSYSPVTLKYSSLVFSNLLLVLVLGDTCEHVLERLSSPLVVIHVEVNLSAQANHEAIPPHGKRHEGVVLCHLFLLRPLEDRGGIRL